MPSSNLSLLLIVLAIGLPLGACTPDIEDPASPSPSATAEDLVTTLRLLPGIDDVEEVEPLDSYRTFTMTLTQPLDHNNPDGVVFKQRLRLLHIDPEAPMVLYCSGYFLPGQARVREPTAILGANQLSVEHRYFWPSQPDPLTWEALTIEQSADDLHHIKEVFTALYPEAWINTGGSKGGMTALFHKRFYPDDVEGTLAYVAPISLDASDSRYLSFMNEVGTAECRNDILAFQREFLLRRPAMLAALDAYAITYDLTYDFLGEEQAIEHMALELPFSFWQYQDPALCDVIPTASDDDQTHFDFMANVVFSYFYSDWYVEGFMPYFYQAATQLGYPAISEQNVSDLLLYPGTDIAPTYVYSDIEMTFNSESMADVLSWIDTSGDRLMLVYGSWDPWTAAQVPLGGATDSHLYMVEGANHGANLAQLPQAEWDEAVETLSRWADWEIDTAARSRADRSATAASNVIGSAGIGLDLAEAIRGAPLGIPMVGEVPSVGAIGPR